MLNNDELSFVQRVTDTVDAKAIQKADRLAVILYHSTIHRSTPWR